MRMILAGAIGASIALFQIASAETASAKVLVKEKISYYNVTGSTGRQIFKSLLDNGPKVGRRNDHALATTEYEYDVKNVDMVIKNGRCVPRKLDVEVRVKYTYPRWKGSSKASRQTLRAWKQFSKSVVWHEKQHVRIALDYAKEYEKALLKMKLRTRNDCSKASFGAVWRATRAALKHNRRQKSFDRKDLRPGGRGYEAQLNLLKAE